MQLQVRIKASDKEEDLIALEQVGGKLNLSGPRPKFTFDNEAQRNEYDRARRKLRETKNDSSCGAAEAIHSQNNIS